MQSLCSDVSCLEGKNSTHFSSLPGTKTAPIDKSCKSSLKVRRVLGIDPGLANTGFGIVDYFNNSFKMISYGVIETKNNCSHGERLKIIYDSLQKVIDEFLPQEASMETLYFAKNVTSALSVAEARGVVTLCLCNNRIPLFEYKPNQIKNVITGTASADKKLVEKFVKIVLNLKTEPRPDHAADALAGAVTHLHWTSNI